MIIRQKYLCCHLRQTTADLLLLFFHDSTREYLWANRRSQQDSLLPGKEPGESGDQGPGRSSAVRGGLATLSRDSSSAPPAPSARQRCWTNQPLGFLSAVKFHHSSDSPMASIKFMEEGSLS